MAINLCRGCNPRTEEAAVKVYGTKGKGSPVQQKILMASLLLMVTKGKSKEVTMGKLIDTYGKVLKKKNMKAEMESSCVGRFGFKSMICNA